MVTYDTDNKVIRLESKGNIELSADRNIVLNAGHNIVMDAKNDIESQAKNDIYRTAGNNIHDDAGNECQIYAGKIYEATIAEGDTPTDTLIYMEKEFMGMQLDGKATKLILKKAEGIKAMSDKDIKFRAEERIGISGKQEALVHSDTMVVARGGQILVEGKTDVNIKGPVVKLN